MYIFFLKLDEIIINYYYYYYYYYYHYYYILTFLSLLPVRKKTMPIFGIFRRKIFSLSDW